MTGDTEVRECWGESRSATILGVVGDGWTVDASLGEAPGNSIAAADE
jgi:hypothetical protein